MLGPWALRACLLWWGYYIMRWRDHVTNCIQISKAWSRDKITSKANIWTLSPKEEGMSGIAQYHLPTSSAVWKNGVSQQLREHVHYRPPKAGCIRMWVLHCYRSSCWDQPYLEHHTCKPILALILTPTQGEWGFRKRLTVYGRGKDRGLYNW